MPEGPEVQTVVNDLNRKIVGRKITGVWTDWPKMIKTGAKVFEREIKGAKVKAVRRRGKNILIDLDKDRLLLVHQKMTGHLLVGRWKIKKEGAKYRLVSLIKGPLEERVNDFIHLIFYLDNGQMLGLSDMRKFAKVLFGPAEEIENIRELKELGPDPLDSKTTFTDFSVVIKKRSRPIKQVLMDQAVVAGIGNIYASDILWLAQIHPLKPASKLTNSELKTLWSASKKVLKQALKLRGTSTADFRDTSGKKGRYGEVRLAYQRTGEPCKRCKTPIKRLKDGGRSAFYCPKCQKL